MQTRMLSVFRGFLSRQFVATLLLQLLPAGALLASDLGGFSAQDNEHWVATWSTTLHQAQLAPGLANAGFNNQTLRQVVHASIGGRQVRVRMSTFGASRLVVGAAHIALSAGDSAVVPGSDRTLTFGGNPFIVVPPGAPVLSVPWNLLYQSLVTWPSVCFYPE